MSQLTVSAPPGQRVPKTFPKRSKKRPLVVELFESPVSLKWIMALSGIAGMGFVLVHMIGNFHVFEGPEEINSYAASLRELGGDLVPRGGVLWLMRFGLIAAILVHIFAAYRLTIVNRKARPLGYQSKRDYLAADFASRTMRITGVWLIFFILYHLADLTWGEGITRSKFIHGDVYNNMVWSLSRPTVAAFYILSMAAIAFHLYHGAWSIFQSLGVNSPRFNGLRRGFAIAFALAIFLGNVGIVLAINSGVVNQDDRCWPTPEQIEATESEIPGVQYSNEEIEHLIAQGACPFQGVLPAAPAPAETGVPADNGQQPTATVPGGTP
jgi:succinate dehydrogenase / fumarate reductase cytochrome b subunit